MLPAATSTAFFTHTENHHKMNFPLLKSACVLCAFSLSSLTFAHDKTCSPQQAQAADAIVDQLANWTQVNSAFKKFRSCDDGSIAEGNSEAIVRLLVDQWDTLPLLATLIKRNPALKRFVLRHIDTTVGGDDLKKIVGLSSSSCQTELVSLCRDIKKAAVRAEKEMAGA